MKKNNHPQVDPSLPEIVIPRENAVFWMDERGRWQNRHGRFEHKRIIDHFNRSIRCDSGGYYVTQERNGFCEKVYFRYVDTPLFVFRVLAGDPMDLELNTGEIVPLEPERLFTHRDQLYQRHGTGCLKFTDRTLMAMAPCLVETPEGLCLRIDAGTFPIPDLPNLP
ncbi:MFS transporter permease [uncultured Desulfosarcina sp.]|uniref:MFS transporter permease n=1 Tax=uncultured Desulfosarcina sp. TaxID=218289 RepID=UPI0029C861BF|nr:MFS transporter permease [uncultured Desulfosarcina sp.]